MTEPADAASRCGFVAVLGAPNAGKSTLINRLVGSKVAIVTPKAQTTRARTIAIMAVGGSQVVFVDTPGIFAPRRRLDRAMVQAAWAGATDADLVLFLVDAEKGRDADVDRVIAGLREAGRTALLALNKIDRVAKPRLLALADELDRTGVFERIFMISALTGDGVEDLRAGLALAVPPGPWLYPEDQLTDISERLLAAEVTREQAFLLLHRELPYALTVETESWQDRPDGSVRVDQVIYVQRESQKAIVLGKGGRMVKQIGRAAREEMTRIFDRRVHLFLFVKVRENWPEDPERYREMGLDFPA